MVRFPSILERDVLVIEYVSSLLSVESIIVSSDKGINVVLPSAMLIDSSSICETPHKVNKLSSAAII